MKDNIKSALNSIYSNKVRSLLTVLGIVIGVASVTILISLGQGLKNDVTSIVQGFGSNVMFVMSGKIDPKDTKAMQNPGNLLAGDILTLEDISAIEKIPGIVAVSPMTLVPGNLAYEDQTASPTLVGAFPNMLESLGILQIEQGQMFSTAADGFVVVISDQTATDLFGAGVDPIGQTVTINKTPFTVVGTTSSTQSNSLFSGESSNFAIMPFDTATGINKGVVKIMRILMKAGDTADVKNLKDEIFSTLLTLHDGEEDFTVFTQDDLLSLFDQFLSLATALVSAIAAISLVVGGIGIMNIMLVTVTERTREIGLRKAVGATKSKIMMQFLTESIFITALGGIIGLLISFTVGAIVAAKTPLTPAITPEVILTAIGISTVTGVVFGLWPAFIAAQKDPIEALRYE